MSHAAHRRSFWLRRIALLVAVLLYLTLTLPQLHLPGLHYDEAKEAGLNALEMLQRQDVQAFRAAGVQVGAVFLPLMVQDYIGALNVFLALPLLAGFGVTVPALRLLGVLCGLATLLLVWALGRELARRARAETGPAGWTGEIAALLLAVNPTFIFWNRQGIFVTNIVVTLAVATVWAALRWQRTGRPAYLYALALLAGLGLWSKLLFVWVLGALAAVAAAAWLVGRLRRPASPVFPPTSLRSLALAGLLFLLALAPLLLYNQQTSGTVQAIFGNLGQSYYGVENTAFLDNLAVRLEQVGTLLRGDHLWYLGDSFANRWALWIFSGLLLLALGAATAGWRRGHQRASLPALLAAMLFVLLLVVQSSFTVSDLFITHFAIIQPFVMLLAALAADIVLLAAGEAARPAALRAGLAALVVAGLAVWFSTNALAAVRYHQALARSGGLASHSDAIDRLAQWLDERDVRQPLALDWGVEAQVRYLTGNRVQPLEIFGYQRLDQPDDGFAGRAGQFLADPTRFYIVRMPQETVFQGRREALENLAAAQGQALVVQEAIYDRSGKVMFVILGTEAP
jgi:hypothetical protein